MGILTLFRMGHFGAGRGWRGPKRLPFFKICHTYPAIMKLCTVIRCLKKIQCIYKSRDTHLEFFWHQHFFTGNQSHQEIQLQIAFWCIISNSFNFFWVFKGCFKKYGSTFDDLSKTDYSSFSWNKGIFK